MKPPRSPRPSRPEKSRPFKGGWQKRPRTWSRAAKDPAPPATDDDIIRLFGVHPVEAALANPKRKIKKLFATDNAARRLADAIAQRHVTPEPCSPRDLDRILGADAVHQGLMLEAEPLPEPDLQDLAVSAATAGPLIVLDQVTDPHNVGAILRSAAAFGSAGIVMTRRHSAPLNGTLAKSASGALELVPIALVQNLARALEELREHGVRLLGLDGAATIAIEDENLAGPVALVLGAEGKGLRQLTAETCDARVRITTADTLRSLNVSNAAAVSLHASLLARNRKA
ncbi:MAG: 23S rRNA (guanosine(2251)-2'-O)-methyltransferase RlmB [Hyphomicrobium sp.]|nr:23S rRNA (guanosine(2251)-2'-O)-methyltransferase RlmB [Hyphomicrobium sp.]